MGCLRNRARLRPVLDGKMEIANPGNRAADRPDPGVAGGARLLGAFQFHFDHDLAKIPGIILLVNLHPHGVRIDVDVFGGDFDFTFLTIDGGLQKRIALVLFPRALGDTSLAIYGHIERFLGAWFQGNHAFGFPVTGFEIHADDVFFEAVFVNQFHLAICRSPGTEQPAKLVLFDQFGEWGSLGRQGEGGGGQKQGGGDDFSFHEWVGKGQAPNAVGRENGENCDMGK